jgi:hypothetical protein
MTDATATQVHASSALAVPAWQHCPRMRVTPCAQASEPRAFHVEHATAVSLLALHARCRDLRARMLLRLVPARSTWNTPPLSPDQAARWMPPPAREPAHAQGPSTAGALPRNTHASALTCVLPVLHVEHATAVSVPHARCRGLHASALTCVLPRSTWNTPPLSPCHTLDAAASTRARSRASCRAPRGTPRRCLRAEPHARCRGLHASTLTRSTWNTPSLPPCRAPRWRSRPPRSRAPPGTRHHCLRAAPSLAVAASTRARSTGLSANRKRGASAYPVGSTSRTREAHR